MKERLRKMKLKERINYGYRVVIFLMIISGIISIMGLVMLNNRLNSYVNGAQSADTAVKTSIIDINIAARSIREMALNDDTSTYDTYKKTVEDKLTDSGTQLNIIKSTGLINDDLYNQYVTALNEWGTVGYAIMEQIEKGQLDEAKQQILTVCTPDLDNLMEIADQMDDVTNAEAVKAVSLGNAVAVGGIVVIVIFIVLATVASTKVGNMVTTLIIEPLRDIENVAGELTKGNLHTELSYRSEDEIGGLAHSLRKSIRILGSYVDDIARAMEEFSKGNFDVQPEVDWKGDFEMILD